MTLQKKSLLIPIADVIMAFCAFLWILLEPNILKEVFGSTVSILAITCIVCAMIIFSVELIRTIKYNHQILAKSKEKEV